MQKDCKLEWIDLGKGTLTDKAIAPLFEGLSIAKTVAYVDLRRNELTTDGWREIKTR